MDSKHRKSTKKIDGAGSLGVVRLLLVWSSLSPVFLLWALRGTSAIPDKYFVPACLVMFGAPSALLVAFWKNARESQNTRTIDVATSENPKDHLLTYLFAILIPLYQTSLGGIRDLAAVAVALLLVVFLFWHLRLHYMNLAFALFGYRIFTVETPALGVAGAQTTTYAIISRRTVIPTGKPLTGYRLGGRVLVDTAE